ncbi:MAG: radical SAM family heme chaperone HemW [Pseudomonadota bacterium]
MINPTTIPLGLYVHIPWCVKKCPYCDFNSHVQLEIPWQKYCDALLEDLQKDYAICSERQVSSIFFGGGTPSLMPGGMFKILMDGIRARVNLKAGAEITIEANPGSVDAEKFLAFVDAGANRLSIGAQSFRNDQLALLGRVHRVDAIMKSYVIARSAGFSNINLDLMHSLPNDSPDGSMSDLAQAIKLEPEHISWYELTIEEGTAFAHKPPRRPAHEGIVENHDAGVTRLSEADYSQYEVSAYARSGRVCQHNLNYWQFGDYIGIGAGAHGKITRGQDIVRTVKRRNPTSYTAGVAQDNHTEPELRLDDSDLVSDFMINALRLETGFPKNLFSERTGLAWTDIEDLLEPAVTKKLLVTTKDMVKPSDLGKRFLNDLQMMFCP